MAASAQAQCPDNLIVNGDFETGVIAPATTDFSWEVYDQGKPDELWDEGDYTVGPNPRDVHPAWAIMTDHSGSGNMLIVNAGITPAMRVWEQAVAVVSGTQYTLTYWLSSTYPANPASIQCSIEGDVSGTTILGTQAAPGPGIWIEVSYTWTAGASDALATITLEDMTYEADGDDFAIDDISLSPPCIEKDFSESNTGPEEEIGIYLGDFTDYIFEITYSGPAAVIVDTVTAEFEVTGTVPPNGDVDVSPATKAQGLKAVAKSATIITWNVPAGSSTLTVTIRTRLNPGKGHEKKNMIVYKPTSCGLLELNDGATAYEPDGQGGIAIDPITLLPIIIVGPSNALDVEAVCGVKPCTPENLVVTGGGASTTLSLDWDDVCGGEGVVYNVYRGNQGGPYTQINTEPVPDSEYDDEDLAPGTYCYVVEAEYVAQEKGKESGKSNEDCGTVDEPE